MVKIKDTDLNLISSDNTYKKYILNTYLDPISNKIIKKKQLIPDNVDDIKVKNINESIEPNKNINIAKWFNEDLSKKLNIPIDGTFIKSNKIINFGKPSYETKFCSHCIYKKKTDLFNFDKFQANPEKSDLTHLKKFTTILDKENLKNKPNKTVLKGLITRISNIQKNLNNLTKTTTIPFYPNNEQDKLFKMWMKEAEMCYNKCVDMYNRDKSIFEGSYTKIKLVVFKELYGERNKGCPYDILTDEVRKFCSNLESCKSNLKNGHIKHFEMKHINKHKNNSNIFIPKTAIIINVTKTLVKTGSIYSRSMGNIDGLEDLPEIMSDCRINYIKSKNVYQLCVPIHTTRKIITDKRESVAGIDSGEVIFVAYHGENSFGEIGKYMRRPILKGKEKIEQYEKLLRKDKNKDGNKIKNKKAIYNKIERQRDRIKNVVKELHNKTALFLCRTYESIARI
jgi:hypothetical protein